MASPLHPGVQAGAELSLQVPFNQTTTTVSFAHRIEVQFEIHVRAVFATGLHLFMDIPITVSNWTRAQSLDVVRRIGPAGTLSNPDGVLSPVTIPPASPKQYSTGSSLQGNPQSSVGWPFSSGAEPTYLGSWAVTAGLPLSGVMLFSSGDFMSGWVAEKLSIGGTTFTAQQPHSVYGNGFSPMLGGSIHRSTSPVSSGRRPPNIPPLPPAKNGPSASGSAGGSAELLKWLGAVENALPDHQQKSFNPTRIWAKRFRWAVAQERDGSSSMAFQEKTSFVSSTSRAAFSDSSSHQPPARRLLSSPPPPFKTSFSSQPPAPSPPPPFTSSQPPAPRNTPPSPPPPFTYKSSSQPATEWLTAAEEKEQAKRFHEAREVAERSQRLAAVVASRTLYESPMESVLQPKMGPGPANGGPGYYLSTEDEKEALRYKRAMEPANCNQVDAYGNENAPVQSEALFLSGPSGPSGPPVAPLLPPNFTRDLSPNQERTAEEKASMRQMYDAQDTVAWHFGGTTLNGPPILPPPCGQFNGSSKLAWDSNPCAPLITTAASNSQPLTAVQERATLKARYAAANDAQSGLGPQPLHPLTRSGNAWSRRPLPSPPVDMHQSPSQLNFSPNGR
ncbi:hypothetical protein FRC01_005206 [Tulasnella sp. 417]|nr:hypothetical protein FRC01_005206 [Tulasnella sp. 417]